MHTLKLESMCEPQDKICYGSVRTIAPGHKTHTAQKKKRITNEKTNKHHSTGHRRSFKSLLTCEQAALECLCIPVQGYSHQEGGNKRGNCTSPSPTDSGLRTQTLSNETVPVGTNFISEPLKVGNYFNAAIRLLFPCCFILFPIDLFH